SGLLPKLSSLFSTKLIPNWFLPGVFGVGVSDELITFVPAVSEVPFTVMANPAVAFVPTAICDLAVSVSPSSRLPISVKYVSFVSVQSSDTCCATQNVRCGGTWVSISIPSPTGLRTGPKSICVPLHPVEVWLQRRVENAPDQKAGLTLLCNVSPAT